MEEMTNMTREQVYKKQKEAMALKIRKILLEDEFYVGSPLAISLKIADALLQGKDECPEKCVNDGCSLMCCPRNIKHKERV